MKFHRDEVQFEYPDNWTVEGEGSPEAGLQVSVSAPGGAFWSLSRQPVDSDPAALAEAAATQLRQEYPDLESEPATEMVFGQCLTGADINFSCLDLTNTAEIRCLETPAACYGTGSQVVCREYTPGAPRKKQGMLGVCTFISARSI